MKQDRVLVEKEFAIFIRGTVRTPDKEVDRVTAFSEHHAIYLAEQKGHTNIAQALNVAGNLYQRRHQQ